MPYVERPGYLALLAVIPLLLVLSLRSLAGLGRVRAVIAIVARCAVVALLILALAGTHARKITDELAVVFIVDRSNSIPRDQQAAAFETLKHADDRMRPLKDAMAVIAADGEPAIEQLPQGKLAIDRLSEPVNPDQTNLAAALRMGMALFPPDRARRLVLVSDGNENVGAALEEAEQFRAANVPIDVVPIRYQHAAEVVFERVTAPPTAKSGETINVQMVLRSQRETTGRIFLYHNDTLIDLDESSPEDGRRVTLPAGPHREIAKVALDVAGAHRFRAVFEPDNAADDAIVANNEGRAFTVVSGQGRVLILTTPADRESAEFLASQLQREKIFSVVELAGENPLDQVRLLEFSAVILSNVPANDMPIESQKALAAYVRELGGGLVMVGGDAGFGAGGWMDSPIEDVMPVSFDVKSKRQLPKGALVLVMHACEIPQGNYWGERVAVAAVKTLSSRDLVGVLSYRWQGGEQGYWDVPLRTVGDKAEVIRQITQMQMGDMPDLDAVMRPGVDTLATRTDAGVRHMIVISDFDPAPPLPDLLEKMKRNRITCSTVAIGFGGHPIDESKAREIAGYTGGKYYRTDDFSQLPQIFIKESRIVRRSLIHEGEVQPSILTRSSPLIAGIEGTGVPPLGGYVLTTAKPLAQLPLVHYARTEGEPEATADPILAHWTVGLGKTVAFTSGMWPRWGDSWAQWEGFSKVWSQIVKNVSRQSEAAAFDIATSVAGGRGRIRIDALDKNADSVNFMTVEGTLIGPNNERLPLRLTQTGPGRYEGDFDARDTGSYVLNLAYRQGTGANARAGNLQTGVSVAYSPEFQDLTPNLALLDEIAARTGGRRLDGASVSNAFDLSSVPKAETRRPLWESLIQLMLLLFLIDVAIRRIAINPMEIARRVRRFIAEMAGQRQPAAESAAVLTTLRGAREQVREGLSSPARPAPGETGQPPTRAARYEAPQTAEQSSEDLSRALGGATAADQPVVARPTGKKPPTGEAEYTSRLLQAKRKARDDLHRDEQ